MKASPSEAVEKILPRHGIGDKTSQKIWFRRGQVAVNDAVAATDTPVHTGDTVTVRGVAYAVGETRETGRLNLDPVTPGDPGRIAGRVRVHCGYHKCLTMYFRRISKKTARWQNPIGGAYRHFFHRADEFYRDASAYTISSVSGHCLDLDRFDDIRAVHIIRDPRDLVVSGYYYHKRGAEHWCDYRNPTDADWAVVNAAVPEGLPADTTFTDYLNSVSLEEGIAAEIEFRRYHLENMLRWPVDDERVLTVRYEDILGNEAATLRRIYAFFEFSPLTHMAAARYAERYSLKSARKNAKHIRNPSTGQWKQHFTPDLERLFNDRYGDVLAKYGY